MAKLKLETLVITKNYPMAIGAHVDEDVMGVVKACGQLAYMVEFEHCMFNGKDTGNQTWTLREDQLQPVFAVPVD